MKLPESIKDDTEKVDRFISSFAENDIVHYKDFLSELRHYVYKSDCPEVAGTITTYKENLDLLPYESAN